MIVHDINVAITELCTLAKAEGLRVLNGNYSLEGVAKAQIDGESLQELLNKAKEWGASGFIYKEVSATKESLIKSMLGAQIDGAVDIKKIAAGMPVSDSVFAGPYAIFVCFATAPILLTFQIEKKECVDARDKLRKEISTVIAGFRKIQEELQHNHAVVIAALSEYYRDNIVSKISAKDNTASLAETVFNRWLLSLNVPEAYLGLMTHRPGVYECRQALEHIIRPDLTKVQQQELYPRALAACREALQSGELIKPNVGILATFLRQKGLALDENLIRRLQMDLR